MLKMVKCRLLSLVQCLTGDNAAIGAKEIGSDS
jgi:hypothetical protein